MPGGAKTRLAEFIRETIAPTSWRTSGGDAGRISEVKEHLVIRQSRRNHEKIAKLLDRLRATWSGPMVTIKARWITLMTGAGQLGFELRCSPVLAADILRECLWSRAAGVIVTSATITALNSFDRFKLHAGVGYMPDDPCCYWVYEKASEWNIPIMVHTGGAPNSTPALRWECSRPAYFATAAARFMRSRSATPVRPPAAATTSATRAPDSRT